MICNSCGWDNDPGSSVCAKCGHVLRVVTQQHAPRPTKVFNSPQQQRQAQPQGLQQPQNLRNCPQCGYPMTGNSTTCLYCGTDISQLPTPKVSPAPKPTVASVNLKDLGINEHVKCVKCGTEVSIDFKTCPYCGERIHLPTIPVSRLKEKEKKPQCALEMVIEEDENTTPITNEYEGASIILNRDNTEADNRTITSKEQAELTYEDGKWYIINKSQLGSTYIVANRKMEIMPDDIIILGDRKFKFVLK